MHFPASIARWRPWRQSGRNKSDCGGNQNWFQF